DVCSSDLAVRRRAPDRPATAAVAARDRSRRTPRRGLHRLAVRPTAGFGLPPARPGRGTPDRKEDHRFVPDLSDPRNRPPRPNPQAVAHRAPGLLRHRRASNGGTEAVNGLIELHRRIARGFRNRHNYRLRMLLIGGGLTPPPHPQV